MTFDAFDLRSHGVSTTQSTDVSTTLEQTVEEGCRSPQAADGDHSPRRKIKHTAFEDRSIEEKDRDLCRTDYKRDSADIQKLVLLGELTHEAVH